MLFAPKSGSETREIIKNKAGEGTDFLKQRSSEIKQTASDWVDKGPGSIGPPEGQPGGRGGSRPVSLSRHREPTANGGRGAVVQRRKRGPLA